MGNLSIFFNTKIQNTGTLAAIGDFGLAPVRYLFNGNDVEIQIQEKKVRNVVATPSFEVEPSLPLRMLKAAAAIILLVPGLLLSVVKAVAYLSENVRDSHAHAKRLFTPLDIEMKASGEINSNPIETPQELEAAVERQAEILENRDSPYQPIGTLRVYLSKAGGEALSHDAVVEACRKLKARDVVVITSRLDDDSEVK